MKIGSYSLDDVLFLLKDITNSSLELSTKEREIAIQGGIHYSEMLPIEHVPNELYMKLFYETIELYKREIASGIASMAEQILQIKGENVVLVSLARGGTPIGILVKRYLKDTYNIEIAHYSISIVRGRGLDFHAIKYILQHHDAKNIQFVDGWTGKGAITKELKKSLSLFEEKFEISICSDIAVLADPAYCAAIRGTGKDIVIPSSFLNATVSGLISRTVLNENFIGIDDFHGVKVYWEMESWDVSNFFVDEISAQFPRITLDVQNSNEWNHDVIMNDISRIMNDYHLNSINLVKPGIGETTRVLLRRIPYKILVKDKSLPELKHILMLAEEKGVDVVEYNLTNHLCCGIIKQLADV